MTHEQVFGEQPFTVHDLDPGNLYLPLVLLQLVVEYSGSVPRIDSTRQTVRTFRRPCLGVGSVAGRPALFCRLTTSKYASSDENFMDSFFSPKLEPIDRSINHDCELSTHYERWLGRVNNSGWRAAQSRGVLVAVAFTSKDMLICQSWSNVPRVLWSSPQAGRCHVHFAGLLEDKLFVSFGYPSGYRRRERVLVFWDWRCANSRVMELGEGRQGEFLLSNVGSDCVMLVQKETRKRILVTKFYLC